MRRISYEANFRLSAGVSHTIHFHWPRQPYLICQVGPLQEVVASHLVAEEEAQHDQSQASLVEKEMQAIRSFEGDVAFHRFRWTLVELEVGLAYLEEGEEEPVSQKMAEAWKEQEACCSEVEAAAEKVPY